MNFHVRGTTVATSDVGIMSGMHDIGTSASCQACTTLALKGLTRNYKKITSKNHL